MIKVKICGITNLQDATWSATLGADYLGFNFYPKSQRKVSIQMVKEILSKIPPVSEPVAIFVDEEIENIVSIVHKCSFKIIQLHGKEQPEYIYNLKLRFLNKTPAEPVNSENQSAEIAKIDTSQIADCPVKIIKAFRIKGEGSLKNLNRYKDIVDYFLLDTYIQGEPGGTGETFNWDVAVMAKKYNKPIFLAGGLTPDNVRSAIEKVQPYAVDVATGVERLPRRKDFDRLKAFIRNVKSF